MHSEKIETMQKIQEWNVMFLIGMFFISMVVSVLIYGCFSRHWRESYQIGLFCCIFLCPIWILLCNFKKNIVKEKQTFFLGLLFFGFSMIGVFISIYMNTCLLWIGGCILITALFPTGIGISFFLFFGCLFCLLNKATVSYEIFLFLIGLVLCGSIVFLKKRKPLLLIIMIDLIIYTIFFFLLTHGSRAYFQWQSVISMIGFVIFLLLANRVYYNIYLKEEEILDEIVKGDFPLMISMQEYSKALCVHCVDVSEFSMRAAKKLGYNEKLCRAGGLYHELGRVLGGDNVHYLKDSVKMAKEYHFPQKVIILLEQLNVQEDMPRSKEAVIVILTDTILSSIDYMEKRGRKNDMVFLNSLVDHIFERRDKEGILESAEISKEEIEILKEFYKKNSF